MQCGLRVGKPASVVSMILIIFKNMHLFRDFSGGPMAKTALPMQGAQVQYLVRKNGKKLNIYLFGCARSSLWHVGSSSLLLFSG